jgi:hypothetical protein
LNAASRILPALCALLAGASLSSCGEGSPATTDAEMTARIVGTWINDDGSMEKTYRADNTSEGSLVLGPHPEDRIYFTSKWEVKNGFFNGEVLSTSDPDSVPVGFKYADKILTVTNRRFVILEEGMTEPTVKHRKRRFGIF